MKILLLKTLGLAALFFGLLSPAFAQVYTIKLLWVYTDAGKATVEQKGQSMIDYALRQTEYANEMYARSGVNKVLFQTVAVYGGNGAFNPPVASLVNTISYPMVYQYAGDIGAVQTARTNPNVNQVRDLANADYVVIVGHYTPQRQKPPSEGGGFFYDDVPGYSGGNCQQNAANAYMGIDAHAAYVDMNIFGHEFAHAACVTHDNGYALFFGSHLEDCMQYVDVMYVNPQPFPIPLVEWKAPAVLDAAPAGWGTSAQNAFNDMTSKCPTVNTVATDFVCSSLAPCSVNQSGDAASCPFKVEEWRKIPPPPPPGLPSTWTGTSGANKITSTGQCPNFIKTDQLSNPLKTVNGAPFGNDPNHNAARTINDNAQRVSKFRPLP